MRTVLLVAGLLGCSCIGDAYAADFFKKNLQPGLDGGVYDAMAVSGGNQLMMYCDTNEVAYKLCDSSTATASCDAGPNDSLINKGQATDICGLQNYTVLSVYRLYDGGTPNCRVYNVNPSSPLCRQ